MVKRRKIALIYQYDENWIGGTYYIQNLIAALNTLPDPQRPELVVFSNDEGQYQKLQQLSRYPLLEFRKIGRDLNILQRLVNKVSRMLSGKNIVSIYSTYNDLDLVFPKLEETDYLKGHKFLYWIPDFQEHYLPSFFSEAELDYRRHWQQTVVSEGLYIVFSSESARNDFNKFYPANKLSQFVLPFAVTHPPLDHIDKATLLEKFNMPEKFFLCSNQFWVHKNHSTVLKAVAILKQLGENIFVAFTGKEHDYRNPEYYGALKKLAAELGISEHISFLGFVSREDQLSLMRYAVAVVQPSLSEGWSTVIEDAKACNSRIIASDLDVHREQLNRYTCSSFFSLAEGAESLAGEMKKVLAAESKCDHYDYQLDRVAYALAFAGIIEEITR